MSDGNESDAFAHLNSGSDAELPSESEFMDSDSEGSDAGSDSDAPRRSRHDGSDDESDAGSDGGDDDLDSEKEDEDKTAGMSNLQREEYMYALSLRNQERRERRAMMRMMKQQKERRAAVDKASGKSKKSKDRKKDKKEKKEKKDKKDKKAKKDKKDKKRSKRRIADSDDDDDEYDEASARKSVRDVLSGGYSTGSLSSDHHSEIAKLLASKQKGKAGRAHQRDADVESEDEGFNMAEFVDDFVDDDDEEAGGARDLSAPRRRAARPASTAAAATAAAGAVVEDDGRVLELKHIKKVQVRRLNIAKMIDEPYFNSYLPGLYVRVTRSLPDGSNEILCGEIMEVFLPDHARRYTVDKAVTDKRVRIRFGSEIIELPFTPVSNQSITEPEFEAFVAATRAAGRKLPTPAQLDRLYVEKENRRRTYVPSVEDMYKAMEEQRRVKRIVTDFEKERIDLVGRIERVRALIKADVASVKTEGADVAALEATSQYYPELQGLEKEMKMLMAAQQRHHMQHQRAMQEAGITRIHQLSSRSQDAKWAKYSELNLQNEEVFVSKVAALFGADKRDWSAEVDRLAHAPGVAAVTPAVAAAAVEAAAVTREGDRKRRRRAPLTSQLSHLYGFSLTVSLSQAAAAAAVTDPIAARDSALEAARLAAGPVMPPAPADVTGVRVAAGSDPAQGLVTLADLNAYAGAGALAQAPQPMMG